MCTTIFLYLATTFMYDTVVAFIGVEVEDIPVGSATYVSICVYVCVEYILYMNTVYYICMCIYVRIVRI